MYYEKLYEDDFPLIEIDGKELLIIVKNSDISVHTESYNINFNIDFTSDEMFEIANWCETNIVGDWLIGCANSGFSLATDGMAFKLRWM